MDKSKSMLKQMRPNSVVGTFPPTTCLVEIDSVKSDELVGNKELAMRVRPDDERYASASHPKV